MKMIWKKSDRKRSTPLKPPPANLPFDCDADKANASTQSISPTHLGIGGSKSSDGQDESTLAESFESEGNTLAENGRYHEALSKWETAIILVPERATLHEQKAQVLLEIGEAWKALKAATRATELGPLWAEAWVTLGRTQLNFGEPEASVESFDKALSIKEARSDRETTLHLVKKKKRLQISGSNVAGDRFTVRDKVEIQETHYRWETQSIINEVTAAGSPVKQN